MEIKAYKPPVIKYINQCNIQHKEYGHYCNNFGRIVTYCGDFIIYANIKSLCNTPGCNIKYFHCKKACDQPVLIKIVLFWVHLHVCSWELLLMAPGTGHHVSINFPVYDKPSGKSDC